MGAGRILGSLILVVAAVAGLGGCRTGIPLLSPGGTSTPTPSSRAAVGPPALMICGRSGLHAHFASGVAVALGPDGSPTVVGVRGAHVFLERLSGLGGQVLLRRRIRHVDGVSGVAIDPRGDMFVTGETGSPLFHTRNAFQPVLPGITNAFVMKLDPSGNVVFSTLLGGSETEQATGIATDTNGDAYVTGWTTSPDFPTRHALEPTLPNNGAFPAGFVAKLGPQGRLLWSTYLGGRRDTEPSAITVDGAGNAYVTGRTDSPNFPLAHPLQAHRKSPSGSNAFVAQFTSSGTLAFGTYLGGSGDDEAHAIAVDRWGDVYVAGSTTSPGFPGREVSGFRRRRDLRFRFQVSRGQSSVGRAFVVKLAPGGRRLVYSAEIGGTGDDDALGLAVDGQGHAFVTGGTFSHDFPLAYALQRRYAGPDTGGGIDAPGGDAFVSELGVGGRQLVTSTFLGGPSNDWGTGIAVSGTGTVYVVGQFNSNILGGTANGIRLTPGKRLVLIALCPIRSSTFPVPRSR